SAQAIERAQVTLIGDPGMLVTVDGAARGPCPVKVMLEPGRHYFHFTWPSTGESKGESRTLKAGQRLGLRADFTGATPEIRQFGASSVTTRVIDDRFEVERLAAEGGMGTVFRALDRQTRRPVAVKLAMPGADTERFLREARVLAELEHPGIVRYVAHGRAS